MAPTLFINFLAGQGSGYPLYLLSFLTKGFRFYPSHTQKYK